MDVTSLVTLIGGAIGLVGGLSGIASAVYQRRQLWLMQQQLESNSRQEQNFLEWCSKYERAVDALRKIYPKMILKQPSTHTEAWSLVFPDRGLRDHIERYLGRLQPSSFLALSLSKEQHLNPSVQNTIDAVLAAVEEFKTKHPEWARNLGL